MKPWIVIDGYNFIYRARDITGWLPDDLQGRRRRLIRMLESISGRLAERITIVFDGKNTESVNDETTTQVEVIFAPADKTADTIIEQMVAKSGCPEKILVVTSDRAERQNVESAGAASMACSLFLEEISLASENMTREMQQRARAEKPPSLLADKLAGFKLQSPRAQPQT